MSPYNSIAFEGHTIWQGFRVTNHVIANWFCWNIISFAAENPIAMSDLNCPLIKPLCMNTLPCPDTNNLHSADMSSTHILPVPKNSRVFSTIKYNNPQRGKQVSMKIGKRGITKTLLPLWLAFGDWSNLNSRRGKKKVNHTITPHKIGDWINKNRVVLQEQLTDFNQGTKTWSSLHGPSGKTVC